MGLRTTWATVYTQVSYALLLGNDGNDYSDDLFSLIRTETKVKAIQLRSKVATIEMQVQSTKVHRHVVTQDMDCIGRKGQQDQNQKTSQILPFINLSKETRTKEATNYHITIGI